MKYFLPILLLSVALWACDSGSESGGVSSSNEAIITTDYGTIVVRLYDETPKHRDNFKKLVAQGFYDELLFHRVINNFMIQGGDPESKGAAPDAMLGNGGPGYNIEAEIVPGKFHKKGALAAARLPDQVNPSKASSGSQFYIVHGQPYGDAQLAQMEMQFGRQFTPEQRAAYAQVGGSPHLDGDYTVFGEVIEGLDVIDKIAAVKVGSRNRPVTDVKMWIKMK